jgi:hypothetical protein
MSGKIFLLFFSFLIMGCGRVIQIDNAGPESWTFQLDEKKYTLASGVTEEISVEEGDHTLSFEYLGNDTLITFSAKEDLFVHAPGQRYLVWRDLYGGQENRPKILNEKEFEWDSVLYRVDVNWLDTNKLIHSKVWDFSIGESFSEEIILQANQNEGLRTRLLRIQDFPVEYQKRASRK